MASDVNTYVTEVGVTCRGMPAIIQSVAVSAMIERMVRNVEVVRCASHRGWI